MGVILKFLKPNSKSQRQNKTEQPADTKPRAVDRPAGATSEDAVNIISEYVQSAELLGDSPCQDADPHWY